MSTITKEWLQQKIADMEAARDEIPFGLDEDDSNTLAAMKLALASLEAEAVAWLLSGGGAKNNVSFDSGNAYADPLREVTPLYTAPPAPVSVPDEDLLHMAASAIDDLLSNKDRSGAGVWADIPAKLRRAAMLQGADGNSPVIPDDVRRMDWLVSKTVDVREPMVYGSHSLFWSQTITDEEDDYQATKLREQIDAAMEAEQAAAPQQEAKDV